MEKERFKITPAPYIVTVKDNNVLLQLRRNTGYCDGQYGLISGHVEKDETSKRALIWESKEESNIILNKQDVGVTHIMHRLENFGKIGTRKRIDIFFTTKEWGGEIKNMEPYKCVELKWFNINKLPKNIISYIKTALENIQKNIFFSEFGF